MSEKRFARQHIYRPPPAFPPASSCTGIVHHLSGPSGCAPAQTFHKSSWSADGARLRGPTSHFHYASWVFHPPTRALARLLGPCFKTGRWTGFSWYPVGAAPRRGKAPIGLGTPNRSAPHLSRGLYGWARRYQPAPGANNSSNELHQPRRTLPGHPFPLHNFMHSFTRLPAVFSSFPRGTYSLSVSHSYLALDGVYHPIGAAFPNNPTLRKHPVKGGTAGLRGSHPLERYLPVYFDRCPPRESFSRLQFASQRLEIYMLGSSLFARRY
jgi:hypothetical protein